MESYLKKGIAATALTIGLAGNVFATCNNTPYVAPEELQPACTEKQSVAQTADTPTANQPQVSGLIDSKSNRNTEFTKQIVLEQSSQSSVK